MPPARHISAGGRFSSQNTCTFTLILQRAKVSKYHQSIKLRFSTQNIKISAVSTPIFARISPFFCIFRYLPEDIGENASKCQKCKNPSHQISEIFRKSAKNGHILILWLYSILWYFAGFLHFHFEICENLQPVKPRWTTEVQSAQAQASGVRLNRRLFSNERADSSQLLPQVVFIRDSIDTDL